MKGIRILFKTKGSHKQGMGDVTSSLALGEQFRAKGHDVRFIINDNRSVIDLVTKADFKSDIGEKMPELIDCVEKINFDVAILNQLNTLKKEALIFRERSRLLVTIEDTGKSAQLADLCFNVLYPIPESFTDLKYIPLAKVFQKEHAFKRKQPPFVKNILVTQGGSDTYGFTPKIIKALYGIHANIRINVVIGPNFNHYTELNEALSKSPRSFSVVKEKSDLSGLMLKADIAVSAGGNTLFELACLGVPSVVVCGDKFEEITAERMQKKGFGINLGFSENVAFEKITRSVLDLMNNVKLRTEMSSVGRRLVGGKGAALMAAVIMKKL